MECIYIASGITSNLVMTTLKPRLLEFKNSGTQIYATSRNTESLEALELKHTCGVKFISIEDSLQKDFNPKRILWFSTHNDPELVGKYAQKAPTLILSSAAIMDFYLKPQSVATADKNGYAWNKYVMAKVPGVHIFVPGFYIEDIGFTGQSRAGLHTDSTKIIFGTGKSGPIDYFNCNNNFDWGRAYSVTPKSVLVKAIDSWIQDPSVMPCEKPIIVCTDRVYRRYELRGLAGYDIPLESEVNAKGLNLPIMPDPIYENFYHCTDPISYSDIKDACMAARRQFDDSFN